MREGDITGSTEHIQLLPIPELAERARNSQSYWRRLIRERKIRFYKVGDLVRISEQDFQAWLAARAVEAE
ncbi:MAG TPA: excisionase family DNA-binding protein [Terriglobales bacterium]|nr:excisionase family DNA-binding protein [Terriglobales bacterium]